MFSRMVVAMYLQCRMRIRSHTHAVQHGDTFWFLFIEDEPFFSKQGCNRGCQMDKFLAFITIPEHLFSRQLGRRGLLSHPNLCDVLAARVKVLACHSRLYLAVDGRGRKGYPIAQLSLIWKSEEAVGLSVRCTPKPASWTFLFTSVQPTGIFVTSRTGSRLFFFFLRFLFHFCYIPWGSSHRQGERLASCTKWEGYSFPV